MEVVNMRDKASKEHNYMNKQEAILQESINNKSPSPTTTTSPPSSSTSPTHEFSFTISLNPPHPPPTSTQHDHNDNHHHHHHRCLTPPPEPLTAIDLSPADDIFFHGHLLPLHPLSPRSSTNSIDSFTLPMKEIVNDQHNPIGNTSFHSRNTFSDLNLPTNNVNQPGPKSKSFTIFSRPKWKKGSSDEKINNNIDNSRKKLKLEVAQLIKRYIKMVKPFMSFPKNKRANTTECNRQPHSFSSNFLSSTRSLPVEMIRRRKFSAPANIVGSGTLSPAKSSASDSTMEELQAAIQAAIAHCKNSIATEDKLVQP